MKSLFLVLVLQQWPPHLQAFMQSLQKLGYRPSSRSWRTWRTSRPVMPKISEPTTPLFLHLISKRSLLYTKPTRGKKSFILPLSILSLSYKVDNQIGWPIISEHLKGSYSTFIKSLPHQFVNKPEVLFHLLLCSYIWS